MTTKVEEDKKAIVKFFLNNHLQITPQALDEILNKEIDINKLIEFAKNRNLIIVDENTLKEFLFTFSSNSIGEIKVVYLEEIKSFSIEDVLEMLKKRFEVLSKIIQENNMLNSVISLSKLKKIKSDNQLVVIGMVKDKTTYSVTLEDFTAYETIQLDANIVDKLFYDDVVAIRVKKEEEKIMGDKIFFPSLSFFRKVSKLEEEVTVYNDAIKVRDKEFKIEGDIVRFYINDFKLFVLNSSVVEKYKNRDEKDVDVLISLIERRHLNPSFLISKKMYRVDLFLMDEVPDALVIVGAKDSLFKVYKGINIFFLPSGGKALLKQRKIE
jgi:DNA polymerase II small subunit/DNA polymerase delta subunit B